MTIAPYYHRHYEHDLPKSKPFAEVDPKWRAVHIALPFLALYQPLQRPLSIALSGARILQTGHLPYQLDRSFAVFSFGAMLFAHPFGRAASAVYDCALDLFVCFQAFWQKGEFPFKSCFHLANDGLYLSLFFSTGPYPILASLGLQFAMELYRCRSQFNTKRYPEAFAHLVMGCLRLRSFFNFQKAFTLAKKQRLSKPTPTGKVANTFHNVAFYLQRPLQTISEGFCKALFTSSVGKVNKLGGIFFGVVSAPITVPLYLLGEGFHVLGSFTSQDPYIYWQGKGVEKEASNPTVLSLNTCMLWGGLPIPLGGNRPPKERIDQLVALIRQEDPDILCFQELSFAPAKMLFEHLKEDYSHFFTRIGPNPFRMESSLGFASKLPIENVDFLPFPNQNGINRGAFFAKTDKASFVTTHLEAGDQASMRKEQMEMINSHIGSFTKKEQDCFVLGDLNIDRYESDVEYQKIIGQDEAYIDLHPDQGVETCTNVLVNKMRGKQVYSNLKEQVDYALLKGDESRSDCSVRWIDTYKEDPQSSLSDHRGLFLTIKDKKKP